MTDELQKPIRGSRLKRWWDLQTMPGLDWMQIEVTTRCTASCFYCPRSVFRNSWDNRDFSLENFRTLFPVMARSKMIHLQGWGEPFLHPHIFEMISLAKKSGSKVGTTTNGMLLDENMIERLVGSGIDHVAFSLTGIGEMNDLARQGTQFDRVMQAIARLSEQKKAMRVETPTIGIAYLLLRSHLEDVDQIVPALAGTGVAQVVISTFDFIGHKDLLREQVSPANHEKYRELKSLFDHLAKEAERSGVDLFYNLVFPRGEGSDCTENPCRALFISADGRVSPCVFSNIPARGSYYTPGGEAEYQKLTFGCIADESLPAIWKSTAYRNFRKHFGTHSYALCGKCSKRHRTTNN